MAKDLVELDENLAKINIEKNLMLEKALTSTDPNEIYKAQKYLEKTKGEQKSQAPSAFIFDPYDTYYQTGGFKQTRKRVSFEVLKKVGDTPIIGSIFKTRIDQIHNFLKFTLDEKEEGYTIRRKKGLFDAKGSSLNNEDKKIIERINNFLVDGGINKKWDLYNDDLGGFVGKIMRDSLNYDQLAFECQRNRRFELIGHRAVDASTIRLLETIDPRYKEQGAIQYEEQFGYLPIFAQVFQSNIMTNPLTNQQVIYYPWELGYGTRNQSTDISKNGYGTSELEVMLDIVTWSLWGMQYNGNFFKQGSNPKGFINIKNQGVGQDIVNDFRQTWRQMISGVQNSHKIPVFSGIDLEWIDLQGNNKDMEFQQWMEFLIIMICSLYTVDPSELGYQFQKSAQMFGQDGQKERLKHSKKKGLKPLLVFSQKLINKYIVSELDENFEFVYTGIDTEDESIAIDQDVKKITAGVISFESAFEKYMGRPYDKKKDTILNPVFLQMKQMEQYGGQGSNEEVDEMNGGSDEGAKNPFEDFEDKALKGDPIMKEVYKYIDSNLNIKK